MSKVYVCTPQLQFSNTVSRWKGATHDSRIFHNSSLYAQCEMEIIMEYCLVTMGMLKRIFYLHHTCTQQQLQPGSYSMLTRGLIECVFCVPFEQHFDSNHEDAALSSLQLLFFTTT